MVKLSPEEEAMYEAIAKAGILKDTDKYLAPLLIGAALDFMFFGVMTLQLLIYSGYARRDRLFNKFIVAVSALFATATTVYILCYIIHLFSTNYGSYLQFVRLDWLSWFPLLDVLSTTTVSIFYLERAYRLYQSIWVLVAVVPFMAGALAGGLSTKILLGSYMTNSTEAYQLRPYVFLWIGCDLIMGVLLTSLILSKLLRSKNGQEVDMVINRLARICAETQFFATLTSVGFLISYSLQPNSALTVCWEMFHPKVLLVGMMTVLNSRRALRRVLHGKEVQPPSIMASGLPPGYEGGTISVPTIHYSNGEIVISTVESHSFVPHQTSQDQAGSKGSQAASQYSNWGSSLETAMGTPVVNSPAIPSVEEDKLEEV